MLGVVEQDEAEHGSRDCGGYRYQLVHAPRQERQPRYRSGGQQRHDNRERGEMRHGAHPRSWRR